MQAPQQITPAGLSDYFDVLTKAVFQSGLSWQVVESKWPGFREAFAGFDPQKVAAFGDDDIERLAADTRIVRNRKKIEATVTNAQRMLELDTGDGGFAGWLGSRGSFEDSVAALRSEFRFMGEMGSYFFLYVVGEPVPSHEEWMKTHEPAPRRK
jgi:3-methyladenine DNA glycosylase Tag